jgi:ATP-dependent DNA helicase RecG
VLTDKGLTYAALILFGTRKAVRALLPRAEVIFEYRSSEAAGPAAQREEFTEGFFNYFDRIWELVNLRNDKQFYRDGLFVLDIYTFNEDVICNQGSFVKRCFT